MKLNKVFYSYSTLLGTIIGVGLFSLPYAMASVGIKVMSLYFLFLGIIAIILHYLFGEISLATPDFKRMPGFANYYFGKKGKVLCFFTESLSLLGALLAYLILGGKFISFLPLPILFHNQFLSTIFYALSVSVLMYIGIKVIKKVEFVSVLIIIVIFFLILFSGSHLFSIKNVLSSPKKVNFFLPYGIILFSLWGADVIPEIEEMIRPRKNILGRIIIISIIIALIFYFLFSVLVVGISGKNTSQDTITGLQNLFGKNVIYLLFSLAIFAIFTSHLTLGITLEKVLWYDLKIKKRISWLIASFLPLLIFLLGVKNFIYVISFVGSIGVSLDGIIISLMYHKLKNNKKSFLLSIFLISIFILGIVYEIIFLIK